MQQEKEKKQEYLIQTQIIEVRGLTGKDNGTADPFIKITVGNLPPQVTQKREKATTAVFNQNFTFSGLRINEIDFENFEIKIQVFDQNSFLQNDLIGQVCIGISTLYRNPNHEIYNDWLTLLHPKEGLQPQGYILVSMYIIGENDRPPVHEVGENFVEDEPDPFDGKPDDQLTPEQLQIRREKQKQLAFVLQPKLRQRSFQLMVSVIKAEDLQVMTGTTCDAFISIRANGITQRTKMFPNQTKPQFRMRLLFPIIFPINNDKIVIRVWDQRICLSDTFIGQIPEIPTENDFFSLTFLQSRGGILPYTWFNIYGIPINERPSDFEQKYMGYKKMALGTAYMGKVLISLNLTPSEKPQTGVEPLGIYREPPIKKYTIKLDVYEVNEAHNCGESIFIRMRVGGTYVDSNLAFNPKNDKSNQQSLYVWREKDIQVPYKDVDLPIDTMQLPDVILELYDNQKQRVAYLRIPAYDNRLFKNEPKQYSLKSVKFKGSETSSEPIFCYTLLNIMFGDSSIIKSQPRIPIKRNAISAHILTIYLYSGYNLCSDMFSNQVTIKTSLHIGQYEYNFNEIPFQKNPIWNQKVQIQLPLDDNLEFSSNLIFTFKNIQNTQKGYFSDNLSIGDIVIQAYKVAYEEEWEYEKPEPDAPWQFYQINKNGLPNGGRILAKIIIQKLRKNTKVEIKKPYLSPIITSWIPNQIHLSLFGIRNLPTNLKKGQIRIRVPLPILENSLNNKTFNEIVLDSKLPGGELETDRSSGFSDQCYCEVLKLDYLQPNDIFLTPQLEIEIQSLSGTGQKYQTEIPLIKYLKRVDKKLKQEALKFFYQESGATQIYQREQTKIQENNVKSAKQSIKDTQSVSSEDIGLLLKRKGIKNVAVEESVTLSVTDEDKILESKEKAWKSIQLTTLLKRLTGFEIAQNFVKRELGIITTVGADEKKYLGLHMNEEQGEELFDYGRDVVKGPYEDIIFKTLPYILFPIDTLSQPRITTNAVLKLQLQVHRNTASGTLQQTQKNSELNNAQKQKYPFDVFNPSMLMYFLKNPIKVKVRVYIYRCLSLAAQQEDIEIRQKLAGLNAISSANPYIEVKIGDGTTGELIKWVSDVDRYVSNTLSPTFLRMYELDAELPKDWCLELKVMSKGVTINSLIGYVKIDLEDRLFGEPMLKQRLAYIVYRDIYQKLLEDLRFDHSAESEAKKPKLQGQITNLSQLIDSFDKDMKIPVEYKSLQNKENSKTTQGSVEMFVEVLPLDIARIVQPQPLSEPPAVLYEVRLIILETFDIPKPVGKNLISIMIEARMDATASGDGEEQVYETDVHNGSENGWGIFNWRMKFNLKTPCEFPRIKIAVYDFSAFGTNESLGEATLSLKRLLYSLRTENKYSMPPTYIAMSSPMYPDQERGKVYVQMSILEKTAADAAPVGNGRDEPNMDPYLETPKEGRGIGDFVKGLSFFPWRFILGQILKILIPMIISGLVSVILFIKPGIMMPKQ